MNKQINFEDNIFILMMRIRMIRDTVTLDADPELFLEKILEDIDFTDRTLKTLLGYLQENTRLIERDELLEHISELEWQFSRVLLELLSHEGNLSVKLVPSLAERLNFMRNESMERRKAAGSLTVEKEVTSDEPIVSTDELAELLKAL